MVQAFHRELPGHPPYSPDLVPNSTAKEVLNLLQNGANAPVSSESMLI